MKKCPFCAEEIQDDAVKCKHCGEWLNKGSISNTVQTISPQNTQSKAEKLPLYKIILGICIAPEKSKTKHKFLFILFFILVAVIFGFIYGFFHEPTESYDSTLHSPEEADESNNDTSPSGNNYFSTGQMMGYTLGSQHSYYRGDVWIENECTAFLKDTMSESPTSDQGYLFIKGCIAGYEQAFGK